MGCEVKGLGAATLLVLGLMGCDGETWTVYDTRKEREFFARRTFRAIPERQEVMELFGQNDVFGGGVTPVADCGPWERPPAGLWASTPCERRCEVFNGRNWTCTRTTPKDHIRETRWAMVGGELTVTITYANGDVTGYGYVPSWTLLLRRLKDGMAHLGTGTRGVTEGCTARGSVDVLRPDRTLC